MDPGLANAEGSSLADDVASADWVILTGLWDGWMEPNSSMDFGSDAPNQVLRDHFCEVGDYEDGQAVAVPPLPVRAAPRLRSTELDRGRSRAAAAIARSRSGRALALERVGSR